MSHRRVLPRLFVPSLNQVVYHGSYLKLNGVTMSEVYQSTLRISFDVRGGLLIRQIHHWAADLFMAAMSAHLLRHFFLFGGASTLQRHGRLRCPAGMRSVTGRQLGWLGTTVAWVGSGPPTTITQTCSGPATG